MAKAFIDDGGKTLSAAQPAEPREALNKLLSKKHLPTKQIFLELAAWQQAINRFINHFPELFCSSAVFGKRQTRSFSGSYQLLPEPIQIRQSHE